MAEKLQTTQAPLKTLAGSAGLVSQGKTIFDGQCVQAVIDSQGIAELIFNAKSDSVNKFNAQTLSETESAISALKQQSTIKGLFLTSGKDVFIVGADITEFLSHFKRTEAEMQAWLLKINGFFSQIEDLDCPTIAVLNGFALGGGMEMALTTCYRVAATGIRIGLPETKLGLIPGWGGTVRLSRLCGADNAIEWIAGGEQHTPEAGLKINAIDAVVAPDKLAAAAQTMMKEAIDGRLDWRARRDEKKAPLKLNKIESTMVFEGAKAFVGAIAGPNYPAPVTAIEVMQQGANKSRDEALPLEAAGFAKVAKTTVAASLVSLFLGDQYLKKIGKKSAQSAQPVQLAAVLGAGIMGGGVAYQSASRKVPIIMKDINNKALDLGMAEASKLLEKQVSKGKMTAGKMAETLGRIRATLNYGDFKDVDLVVEAVVENEKIKKSVLAELEGHVKPGAILTSNTSTISITRLAEGLKNPENFCGMHFFNPVHRMPLVEVIRGAKSSAKAVATTVAYALAMGKNPIVVNDCAGFLVNRILFPYFVGFMQLVNDGIDFKRIDKVMEKFGWPMGPAYLIDVIGIDTAHHVDSVMSAAFPDRMKVSGPNPMAVMYEAKRFGQKNGLGFYKYTPDKKGPPKKEADPIAYELLAKVVSSKSLELTDEQIVDRMMIPMIIESSRCLEDKIVNTPTEVDLGLIYGLGFPPFRGGALRYADTVGLKALVEKAKSFSALGKLYEPTEQMKQLAANGQTFYQN